MGLNSLQWSVTGIARADIGIYLSSACCVFEADRFRALFLGHPLTQKIIQHAAQCHEILLQARLTFSLQLKLWPHIMIDDAHKVHSCHQVRYSHAVTRRLLISTRVHGLIGHYMQDGFELPSLERDGYCAIRHAAQCHEILLQARLPFSLQLKLATNNDRRCSQGPFME